MQRESSGVFPTVLVAELDAVSPALANDLRSAGYNVLEAHDWTSAGHFVKTHSRPIHLLVTNWERRFDTSEMLGLRPRLRILFVSDSPIANRQDELDPGAALTAVKKLFT
jgi:hypothetical protein